MILILGFIQFVNILEILKFFYLIESIYLNIYLNDSNFNILVLNFYTINIYQ